MAESTGALPPASFPPENSTSVIQISADPSTEGVLENPIPPYQKSYKIIPLSIFRHIIYWTLATFIIFLITKSNHTADEAYAITFISVFVLFVIFNIGYWIASRFYDISSKCYDPKLLSQAEIDRIESELSQVKERLDQAKDVFNAAETPEAQEEARNRMTELYVAKQTLSKAYSQQALIRPKLMFLIVYGSPYVRIADPEANEVATRTVRAPLINAQQPSASTVPTAAPSSSGTNTQAIIAESHESVYGSTVALCEKRKNSDNSDTNVY